MPLLRSILILSSHLSLGLPSGTFFPQVFPTKTLYAHPVAYDEYSYHQMGQGNIFSITCNTRRR